MTSIAAKADHVRTRASGPTGGHTCHWPGCDTKVPPAMWGCKKHWFKLPQRLRSRIWATYRIGQEDDKKPSAQYLQVALEVRSWIEAHAETLEPSQERKNDGSSTKRRGATEQLPLL